ncbi:NAD(P)H-binding protein [Streptomyces sp. NPDC001530]|uniref:NAD(P)H-binding protein n=1 Tax=Streptomyces sp. NPDC001530 TaxID=3364582 RepID=UPI00369A1CD8
MREASVLAVVGGDDTVLAKGHRQGRRRLLVGLALRQALRIAPFPGRPPTPPGTRTRAEHPRRRTRGASTTCTDPSPTLNPPRSMPSPRGSVSCQSAVLQLQGLARLAAHRRIARLPPARGRLQRPRLRRRRTRSPRAQYVTGLGATYIQGDVADQAAIDQAMNGVNAVFAVPVGAPGNDLAMVGHAALLIESAERADVDMFVQTTVAGLERHLVTGDYGTGYHSDEYAAARLRTSTLRRWVVLRPVTLMENFLPQGPVHVPLAGRGRLDSIHSLDKQVQLVSVVDIARFAVAARRDPHRFDRQIIELTGDEVRIDDVADVIGDVTNTRITYRPLTVADALREGMFAGVAHSQEWANQVGYGAPSPTDVHKTWGIEPMSFAKWARDHADLFDVPR